MKNKLIEISDGHEDFTLRYDLVEAFKFDRIYGNLNIYTIGALAPYKLSGTMAREFVKQWNQINGE